MAIVQKIEFKSPHKYFAGFLQNLIDETKIRGSVEFENGQITLVLDLSEPSLVEKFSQLSQKYLPHSIFLGKIETVNDESISPKNSKFTSPAYPIAPCPICLEELTDPKSPRYLDDTITCQHYSNSELLIDNDYTIFSPHFNNNDTVLLCDANRLTELFYVSENEIKALFSIEKPSLVLTIKDEELKEITGKKFIKVKSPYNIKSALVALNAKDSQIDTLFFDERESEPSVVVVQDYLCMIYDNRISQKLENLDSNLVLNRFKNIQKEANYSEAIGANLSQKGISFIVSNTQGTKEVIKFGEFDIKECLANMQNDEIRSRLLANFQAKFPNILKILETQELNIFEAISAILELDKMSFEALSMKSLEFRGNGGLKIDMNFTDERFDYEAMLGSIMSFKLANVDNFYLAYSIFEAYGDMAVSTLSQLKQKFKIDNFILFGDIFSNGVLFSRVLSKFTLSTPYFSRNFALDSRE
jgi:hydrogenase maturation factor HypF (carbamoyltransferase family)